MDLKDRVLFPIFGTLLKTLLLPIGRMRLPRVNGKISIPGLNSKVEILRDKWGVVHIYGVNIEEVVFAQGYVHAQERLWQMDFNRRVVFGRLSEILGKAGLAADKAMRTLSLYKTSEKEAELVTGEFCKLLESYRSGVNTWIETAIRRHKLPLEFMLLGYQPEPWQVADTFCWGKLMSWVLACNWQSELYRKEIINRLGAEKTAELDFDPDQAWAVILDLGEAIAGGKSTDAARDFTGPHAGEGVGSNNWAVSGSRTTSGKPLLANDMHLELTSPGLWFENHLAAGDFNVTGVTMPGVPMVVAGHNRNVAWGFTDGCPDTQDLYEEHLRQTNQGSWEYEFKQDWIPAEVRHDTIHIKGGKSVTQDVLVTRHGPVVNSLFSEVFPEMPPLALRWTALEPGDTFQAVYAMNQAKDCYEFRKALRHFDDPSQNVVYADTQGNIAYSLSSRVPIREKGDGSVPAPGWTGDHEWIGYVPFESMPHLFNPPRGYVATANNQVERPDYPYFLGRDYLVSDRAGRIVELLEAREKIDVAYIQRMQTDQVSISARCVARAIGQLNPEEPELAFLAGKMKEWDGSLHKQSLQACLHEVVSRLAIRLLLGPKLGELGVVMQSKGLFLGQWPDHFWEWFTRLLDHPDSPWFDLGHGETREDVLLMALRQAVDFLKKELGPDPLNWNWGRLHQLTFGHVLGRQKPLDRIFDIGPYPIGGDGTTIWSSFSSWADLQRRPVVGPPFRFIADLCDLDHCWGMLVPGQSGHFASSHFKDGVGPWFEGKYHPMLFRREEVEQNLEGKLVLEPG